MNLVIDFHFFVVDFALFKFLVPGFKIGIFPLVILKHCRAVAYTANVPKAAK